MHRSHSRHTHPAGKMFPMEEMKFLSSGRGEAKRFAKHFHGRKSRRYLKSTLND